jgi:hypothetical protein
MRFFGIFNTVKKVLTSYCLLRLTVLIVARLLSILISFRSLSSDCSSPRLMHYCFLAERISISKF